MKRYLIIVLLILACRPSFADCQAQFQSPDNNKSELVRVLLLVDCSRSMWNRWQSDTKIKITQNILLHFLDSINNNNKVEVALRVFGHLNHNSYGTRLECPFGLNNRYQLQSKIKTLVPNGGCTAATALDDALGDFPATDSSRNIIFVITDGLSGGNNICEVAHKIQLSGLVVKTYVLNIAADLTSATRMDCAGIVLPIPDEESFMHTLSDLFLTVQSTSHVVLQLSDTDGKPFTGDIPYAFYDRQNRKQVYSKVYTGSIPHISDTILVDPLIDYDIEMFTRPSIVFRNRTFRSGKTYTLASAVEQGRLCVRRDDKHVVWNIPDYPVVVRQHGKADLVSTQSLGDSVKYLAGTYDIEILTNPPIALNGIEISRDAVTELSIPAPGMLMFERMKSRRQVSVFGLHDGRMQLVREFTPNPTGENLILMPGDYLLITKPLGKTSKSTTTTVKIQSGKQTVAKIE